MTGSRLTHLTPSGLLDITREHDKKLTDGIVTSASGSDFSIHTAILRALQQPVGRATSSHEITRPLFSSMRVRGLDQRIISDLRSSKLQRLNKLGKVGLTALQGLSVGSRAVRELGSAWQDVDHEECALSVMKRSANRRKKQLTKRRLVQKINNSIKKISHQEKIIQKNIIQLGRKFEESKKHFGKNSLQILMNKKKINNIISQSKQAEKTAKEKLAKLVRKGKEKKILKQLLLSKKPQDRHRIGRLLKKIGQAEKINKKNHIKLKNHTRIKALLRKAKQQRLAQDKWPKPVIIDCLANPLNGEYQARDHNVNRSLTVTQGKKALVLRGGGDTHSKKSSGGLVGSLTRGVVRTLAAQASMTTHPSATLPLFRPSSDKTTVGPSRATTQKRVTVATPYQHRPLGNQQGPVATLSNNSAHDLAYRHHHPKKPKINPITLKQCDAVAHYLINNGFFPDNENYKSHPELLIYKVIQFIKQDENGKKIISSVLQKAENDPTEKLIDPLSKAHQDSIINHWINQLVFKKNADEFIIELFVSLERIYQFSYNKPINNIIGRVQDIKTKIENFIEKKISNSNEHQYIVIDVKKYIINNIIGSLLPIINQDIKKLLNFVEFGYINAGYQLEKIYTGHMTTTPDEALALGKMIYAQATEGAVDPFFRKTFFKIPAMLHYAKNNLNKISLYFSNARSRNEIEKKALNHYFNEIETNNKQEDDNNKAMLESVTTLNDLMNHYKNRSQLSDDIRKKQCPIKDQTSHLNGDNFCVTEVKHPVLPQMGLTEYYGHTIEDATEKFDNQIKKILNQASKVHYLIFSSLFNNLNSKDKEFISTSEVKELNVHIEITSTVYFIDRPATYNRSSSGGYGDKKFGYSQHDFPTVKQLFVANNNGEKKYFLMKIENDEYSIIKVNNTIENYYNLLETKESFNKEKYHYLETHEGEVLKNPQDSIKILADNIFNKKEGEFLKKHLHDQGYDETFLEKFKEFLLSCIPFRDCVNFLKEGKIRSGIASCGVDLFLMIPSITAGSKALLASAKVVGKGGEKTLLKLSMSGARNSLKKSMPVIKKDILKLQKIAKKNTKIFGGELILAVDPGIGTVIDITRVSIKQLLKIGRYMQDNIPNLKNALDKIKNRSSYHEVENIQPLKSLPDNFNPKMVRPKSNTAVAGNNKDAYIKNTRPDHKVRLTHQWGTQEFSKIAGLENYNIKVTNIRHQKILDRHFIYDVLDKDKVLEIKNINNKFQVKGNPCERQATRIIKRGANCVKGGVKLEGIEKINEIKHKIFSVEEIKINYGIKNSENCEKMAKLVRETLTVDENIVLETRGIGLWGDIEGGIYGNHFVVKETLKETGEIFIIDVANGIISSERKWLSIFLKKYKEKEFFIQYADFKTTNFATREFPVFPPNTPLLNAKILKEPEWYYKSLESYGDNYFNGNFYEGKLKLNAESLKNDLMMRSNHGVDFNKKIYLNNNWYLEKINVNGKPYVDGNQLGSEISVSFYLSYNNKGSDFVEIPQLRWDEQIKVNSVSEGDWMFPTTNMYEHNFRSNTFYIWRNRYSLAYDSIMKKKQKGEVTFVQLMDRNGKKVNTDNFIEVSSTEEKTQQVIDYLNNNGGELKVTIVDLPRVRFRNEFYERKVDFSIGFGDKSDLATFTQGVIENRNTERVAFVTTSKDLSVAEKFDPKAIAPETVSRRREKTLSLGERE